MTFRIGYDGFPAKPGETFREYIHRLAKTLGHLVPEELPARAAMAKRGGCMERIDAIFAPRRKPGEPGLDVEEQAAKAWEGA